MCCSSQCDPRVIFGPYFVSRAKISVSKQTTQNLVAVDVDGAAKIFGKEFRDKQNVRYMRIEKMLVDFKLQKSRFRVRDVINHGNIIGGNKQRLLVREFCFINLFVPGEAMNQFLNNNADEIIREMKPAATVSIARHFKGFLNSAFLQLPLNVWLPDA